MMPNVNEESTNTSTSRLFITAVTIENQHRQARYYGALQETKQYDLLAALTQWHIVGHFIQFRVIHCESIPSLSKSQNHA
jgi:hypothetical protein